ncbi:Endosulphine [Macleaya cordata]|uniref:Endosulphine n=1 Tax=Macleaya cordata TaxID=56857 RepID=A0A200QET1_MACCD|nr:Endosulphine [Macleaya cordata]
MSSTNVEDAQKQEHVEDPVKDQVDEDVSETDPMHVENSMPSPQEEEAILKKKYGGILPKKTPLISKDHERAFFDSADWALGKQGGPKPKGPLEALRPKLQPTPQQQVRSRRSAYAPSDDGEDGGNSNLGNPEDQNGQ